MKVMNEGHWISLKVNISFLKSIEVQSVLKRGIYRNAAKRSARFLQSPQARSENGRLFIFKLHIRLQVGTARTRVSALRPTSLPRRRGIFQLGMLLPEFAGYRAERNACGLREIRSRPFSLGGGVIRSADDALSRRHRRISCVFRMTRKLIALRLIADSWHAAVLRKRRGGGKQAEQEHGLFHCRVSRLRRKRGIIRGQRGGCWLLQSE